MAKPIVSYRRIDQLKAIAFDCGFTNEDAKQLANSAKLLHGKRCWKPTVSLCKL
jgi:hypothetical protein